MGVTLARALIGGFGALLMLGGIALVAIPAGDPISAVLAFLVGSVLVAGVLLEHTRYRSLHAETSGEGHGPGGGETVLPDGRFRATGERFLDPSTGVPMRVWVDPTTGDRRYVPER